MNRGKLFLKIAVGVLLLFLIIVVIVPELYDYIYGYFVFTALGRSLTTNMTRDFDKAANVAF